MNEREKIPFRKRYGVRDDHAHLWFLSQVLSSNAFFASPLPSTYLLTEPNREGFISVFPIVWNQVFMKVVSMGLDRHDLHGSAISFELSFSHLFVLFCFLNYPSKLRRENKEIRSGALWFSYKYIAVLKFATHKKWTKSVSLAKSTGPLLRRKASAFRKVHNKVFVKSLRERFCSCS